MNSKTYDNPLTTRYASEEMNYLFSPEKKFTTWRRLWLALAEAEAELGLDINDAQISDMKRTLMDLDLPLAATYEKKLRHVRNRPKADLPRTRRLRTRGRARPQTHPSRQCYCCLPWKRKQPRS